MERVNFTWYDHSGHVTDAIQEMFFSNAFKDVTLVSEDKNEIKAHKNILSASSPVLKRLITDNNGNQPILLDGIKYNELLCVLQYVYLGETKLFKANMNPFLIAAKKLQIKDLEKNVKKKIDELKVSKLTLSLPKTENEEVEILDVKDEKTIVAEYIEPSIEATDEAKGKASSKEHIESQENKGAFKGKEDCVSAEKPSQLIKDTNELEKKCSKTLEDDDPYMLKSKIILKENKKKERVSETFFCEDCSYQTRSKGKLENHMKVYHLGIMHKCDQCDYEAKYIGQLKSHISTKHEGVIFKCQLCDLHYSRKGHLKRHVQTVHEEEGKEERKHKCHKCSYSTFNKGHLWRHVARIHDEGRSYKTQVQSRKFQCPQCDYKALTGSHLKRHMLRKHACPHCDFVAAGFLELQKHSQNLHGKEVFMCKVCNKVLKDEGLQEHMEHNHGVDAQYSCKECDYKFKMSDAYKRHMLFKHKDENVKNINCKYCPEKFIFKRSHSDHMKTKHTHTCDACDYVCRTKLSLEKHKKAKHAIQVAPKKKSKVTTKTTKKSNVSFKCKFCPEKFDLKLTLKKHMKSNHVEHTYSCDLCGYVGMKQLFVDLHKRMKHNVKLLSPKKKTDMTFIEALETRTKIQEPPVQKSHELSNKIDSFVVDYWS